MKNFAWIICIVLIGFLSRSIYKGNTKLSLAIFLCLLLAGAVWVIVQLIRKQKENTVAESLNRYHAMMTEAELINLEKANKDMDIEIAGLKVQLDVAQENADELEKKIAGLEKKCREYEEREESLNGIVPGILATIFRNVVERIKKIERLDGVTPSLFEAENFDQCANAYEQLCMICNDGFLGKYDGENALKKQLREYLLDEYYGLYPNQQERLVKYAKRLDFAALKGQFYDLDEDDLEDMISGDYLDEVLLAGFEDFIQNQRNVSIAEKYGIDPNAVTDKNHGTMELIYPEGSVWVK